MTDHFDIMDELHALKQEAGHLLATGAEELREASNQRAKAIATDLKAFLTDFRDALAPDTAEVERAFAGKAATALATALALGIVIGRTLRRK
jgi:Holliday junction resolvasome RuvABC endonuclease subunit